MKKKKSSFSGIFFLFFSILVLGSALYFFLNKNKMVITTETFVTMVKDLDKNSDNEEIIAEDSGNKLAKKGKTTFYWTTYDYNSYVEITWTYNRQNFIFTTTQDQINELLKNEDKDLKKILYKNNKVVNGSFVPLWYLLISSIFPTLFFVGMLYLLYTKVLNFSEMGGKGIFGGKIGKVSKIGNVLFKDVAGLEEEKEELLEIVDYLKNPLRYQKMGAHIPKGIMLIGPAGTGKTLLAKAVAGEAGVNFFATSGSEFEEMFVGLGASRIRNLFVEAKKNAPAIIFIDEIDSVGTRRSFGRYNDQTLNQLLAELDGFEENSGVVIIAASNRLKVLDPALLRPGRFDRQIQVNLPDVRAREEILKVHSRNKNISPQVDFYDVANRTQGFSGAQLANVVNEATILSVRKRKNVVTNEEIDEAIDRVIAGPAKKTRVVSSKDKRVAAYHEAGHAVIGLVLEDAYNVQKITIVPRGRAGGYTVMSPKEESGFFNQKELVAQIIGLLGGRVAEEIVFGTEMVTTGGHDDFGKASMIAERMVCMYWMSTLGLIKNDNLTATDEEFFRQQKTTSEKLKQKIDFEIKKILDKCYVDARKIIIKRCELLDLVAKTLIVIETITKEQIEFIFKNNQFPVEVEEIIKKHPEKQMIIDEDNFFKKQKNVKSVSPSEEEK